MGLIRGLKLFVDNTKFIEKLMKHKLLAIKAEENVIRLFPPLVVTDKELDEGLDKIEQACKYMS